MGSKVSPGKPRTRRYSPAEKEQAVLLVRTLRPELGTDQGPVHRVARQLGHRTESVRSWVRQADIDQGRAPGVSTTEASRIAGLEQENRELMGRRLVVHRIERAAFRRAETTGQALHSPGSTADQPPSTIRFAPVT